MDLSTLESQLLSPDFDVEKHASELLQSSTDVGTYVANLSVASKDVDILLEDHVSKNHNDLLTQATSVEHLEAHLSTVSLQSESLLASVDRLKAKINEPYESLKVQTLTLARLQKTCDVLRRIIRILQLSKKLQSQLSQGQNEITKAASSLNELAELFYPAEELSGIDLIEQDQRILLNARVNVEKSADTMLQSGMESKSQNHIGIALQVYFNLSVLPAKIQEVLEAQVKEVQSKLDEYLDGKKINESIIINTTTTTNMGQHPGRTTRALSSVPSSQNLAAFRSVLWTNLEAVLDIVFSKLCQVMQLQKILVKKKDVVLGTCFAEMLEKDQRHVVKSVWAHILECLNKSLKRASTESSVIKQTLEGEFPKLVRLFNDLWARLCQASLNSSSNVDHVLLDNPFESGPVKMGGDLRKVLVDFERQYLSRSLARLFDPVNLMFSTTRELNPDELDNVFKAINSELAIGQVDLDLSTAVCRNVAKTVQLLCAKCEQMLDNRASQVVGYPTEEQRRNVQVVNCLFAFYAGMLESDINMDLKDIERLIRSAIEPLIGSIKDAVEAILLTMHNEDFTIGSDNKVSPYMKELEQFLNRVCVDFLSQFDCKTLLAECVFPLAAKSIEMFILHGSLARPVSAEGQKTLVKGCQHLQNALEPLVTIVGQWDSSALHCSFGRLNAFKQLLLMQPEEFFQFEQLSDLKYSTALHLLFSKAPPEMKSPHDSAGWSISRYSAWLEDHTNESDRLQLIQGALESYVASTRLRKEKAFAFPYNIMLQLLHTGLTQQSSP